MKSRPFWIGWGVCVGASVLLYLVMVIPKKHRAGKLTKDLKATLMVLKGVTPNQGNSIIAGYWRDKKEALDREVQAVKDLYVETYGKRMEYFGLDLVVAVDADSVNPAHKVPDNTYYKPKYIDHVTMLENAMTAAGVELPPQSPFHDWGEGVPDPAEIRNVHRQYWIGEYLYQRLREGKARAIHSLRFETFRRAGRDGVGRNILIVPLSLAFDMDVDLFNAWFRQLMNGGMPIELKSMALQPNASSYKATVDAPVPLKVTMALEVRLFDPFS